MKSNLYILFILLFLVLNGFGQEKELKIITYNIWNEFDWGKDEERRENLCGWIKEQNPTIVGL